jgi:hypothetical protein
MRRRRRRRRRRAAGRRRDLRWAGKAASNARDGSSSPGVGRRHEWEEELSHGSVWRGVERPWEEEVGEKR